MTDNIAKNEILSTIERFVEDNLNLLLTVENSWQPTDFLPDSSKENWYDELRDLRKNALSVPDEVLVVLVGNTVTEEALPSYQTWLNRVDAIADKTGASLTPWARWSRGWTAEENRHGDLLNRYLYLSGRVNMRSFEITSQYLIKNGFDVRSSNDSYKALAYTSFQERATKISHRNTGLLAAKHGDAVLGRICEVIAGDEARHEEAYKRFFLKVLELDPSGAVIAFKNLLKQQVVMPARLMSDGSDRDLFSQFSIVAQKAGVYTVRDYAAVISHLVEFWGIDTIKGLTPEAEKAQQYLCGLSDKYAGKAEAIDNYLSNQPKQPFSWIYDRQV
jgi:acyl-[acyl-carrier-protein] desaturase